MSHKYVTKKEILIVVLQNAVLIMENKILFKYFMMWLKPTFF